MCANPARESLAIHQIVKEHDAAAEPTAGQILSSCTHMSIEPQQIVFGRLLDHNLLWFRECEHVRGEARKFTR